MVVLVAILAASLPLGLRAAGIPNTLTRLGLYDAAHTGPDGLHVSSLFFVDESRWMTGISVDFDRTAIDSEDWTYTGWVMSPDTVIRTVGFRDALHTRADGFRRTWPYLVNREGVVLGASVRFDGMNDAGQSAWLEDRWGNIVKIGFYDPAHTATSRGVYKYSSPLGLNDRNQAIGYSMNNDTRQTTAWLANSVGSIQRIGLYEAAHTAPDGATFSIPVALNDAGYVIGASAHYVAGTQRDSGATPWVRMPWGTTRRIGFQTGIHRSSLGQHAGAVNHLTESGFISGTSQRYRPVGDLLVGQTAWVTHAHDKNRPVGFYSGVHITSQLVAYSDVSRINERGISAGFSRQYSSSTYDPGASIGLTTWMAKPDGTTVRVGLYDAEHTAGGAQENRIDALNGIDSATGSARRFGSGGIDLGQDAWVANIRGQTTKLGLTDAWHTRADGYRESVASVLNDTGWVAGWSARYDGMERRGETAWLYNRSARTYLKFEIAVPSPDGTSSTNISHLHEDGSAVGSYAPFVGGGTEYERVPFVYTSDTGVVRLSERFGFGVEGFGWDRMDAPTYSFGSDHLVGPATGFDPGTGELREQSVYLLHTP